MYLCFIYYLSPVLHFLKIFTHYATSLDRFVVSGKCSSRSVYCFFTRPKRVNQYYRNAWLQKRIMNEYMYVCFFVIWVDRGHMFDLQFTSCNPTDCPLPIYYTVHCTVHTYCLGPCTSNIARAGWIGCIMHIGLIWWRLKTNTLVHNID